MNRQNDLYFKRDQDLLLFFLMNSGMVKLNIQLSHTWRSIIADISPGSLLEPK